MDDVEAAVSDIIDWQRGLSDNGTTLVLEWGSWDRMAEAYGLGEELMLKLSKLERRSLNQAYGLTGSHIARDCSIPNLVVRAEVAARFADEHMSNEEIAKLRGCYREANELVSRRRQDAEWGYFMAAMVGEWIGSFTDLVMLAELVGCGGQAEPPATGWCC